VPRKAFGYAGKIRLGEYCWTVKRAQGVSWIRVYIASVTKWSNGHKKEDEVYGNERDMNDTTAE
jgi:hypothetical protein